MKETIGAVTLDYTYYNGTDGYTDGDIEDELLEHCKEGTQENLLQYGNDWAVLYHLSGIRENLLEWYPFTKRDSVLEVGAGCGGVTGVLSKKAGCVTCIEMSKKRSLINAYRHKEQGNIDILVGNFQDIEPHLGKFDYVTLIGVLEYSGLYILGPDPYSRMLSIAKKHLKPNGKLIIAIENKTGLKYWNGAAEDHTGKLYSGLNDYVYDRNQKVRTFSKMELETLLSGVGIRSFEFFYPMPDYKLPGTIYCDNMLPLPGMERNYGKDYSSARLYNFNDAIITDQVCADGMFRYFSNSFLVVAGGKEKLGTYVKYNRVRKTGFQIKTEIFWEDNGILVRKSALTEEAGEHIRRLKQTENWSDENFPQLNKVTGKLQDTMTYVIPYIKGTDLDQTFYIYRNDSESFLKQTYEYLQSYFQVNPQKLYPFYKTDEFERIFGSGTPEGKGCLQQTNIDLIFSNLRLTPEGKLYCIDNEWVFDFPIPYEYVIWRSLQSLYGEYSAYLNRQVTRGEFMARMGISSEDDAVYQEMERNFYIYVYGKATRNLAHYQKGVFLQDIHVV